MVMTERPLAGARIGALCELEGISRRALASELQINPAKLSKIEAGAQRFTEGLGQKLSLRYGLPLQFFRVHDPIADAAVPTFRKRARARVVDEKRVVRLAREATRVFAQASSDSGYKPFSFPDDAELLADVEQCAIEVRRAGGLDDAEPVPNVTRLLERLGMGVVAGLHPEPGDVDDHSGLALPTSARPRPIVLLPTRLPGAVARFTLAHEAAHHIWDADLPAPLTSTRDPRERRAHQFAGALLLPAAAVRRGVHEGTTLRGLLPVKADYGVSVGTIIYRAKTLGLISDERARSLQIQLSSLGWRDPAVEPVDVSSERPLLLKQALSRVTDMSALGLARYSGLKPELLRYWMRLDDAATNPHGGNRERRGLLAEGNVVDLAAARSARSPHRDAAPEGGMP